MRDFTGKYHIHEIETDKYTDYKLKKSYHIGPKSKDINMGNKRVLNRFKVIKEEIKKKRVEESEKERGKYYIICPNCHYYFDINDKNTVFKDKNICFVCQSKNFLTMSWTFLKTKYKNTNKKTQFYLAAEFVYKYNIYYLCILYIIYAI